MTYCSNVEHYMCPDCFCVYTKKELSIEELDHLPDFKCCCKCHDGDNEE